MKKLLFLLLLPGFLEAQTLQTKVVNGGAGVGNFNELVYFPPGFTPTKQYDTWVQVVGLGEFGSDASKLSINGMGYYLKNKAWKPNQVVVCLQPPGAWPPANTDQPLLMRAFFKEILSGPYGVNPARIFGTGYSYGALYLYHYIQREVDSLFHPFAAIVPMSMGLFGLSGDYGKGTDALSGNDFRFKNIPFIGYVGASDPGNFLQPMQRYVSLLGKAGCIASWATYPGAHGNWNLLYDPAGTYQIYAKAMQYTYPLVTKPPVNPVHARLWVDSTVIHYPTTTVLLIDSSTGATSTDLVYTVNTGDNTGRFAAGDLKQGILLGNLVEGSYLLKLAARDGVGNTDTASVQLTVYGPPKCPVCPACPTPRTVKSIQLIGDGTLFTIPKSWYQITYSDGTTETITR